MEQGGESLGHVHTSGSERLPSDWFFLWQQQLVMNLRLLHSQSISSPAELSGEAPSSMLASWGCFHTASYEAELHEGVPRVTRKDRFKDAMPELSTPSKFSSADALMVICCSKGSLYFLYDVGFFNIVSVSGTLQYCLFILYVLFSLFGGIKPKAWNEAIFPALFLYREWSSK